MQVICTDGTAFTCESYELTEYGAVLYDKPLDPESERYESDRSQSGYVPHDRLWYILPDGVTPNIPGLSAAQGQPRRQPHQPPDQPPEQPPIEHLGQSPGAADHGVGGR